MSGLGRPRRAPVHRISVRARLTLLYGAMFYGAGVVLLLVTYLLVRSIMSGVMVVGPFGERARG